MPGSTPHAKTVTKKVGGAQQPGRPLAVKPYRLNLSQDRSRDEGYRFLWQKIKPEVIKRADERMKGAMPTNLMPQALQVIEARKHRREH